MTIQKFRCWLVKTQNDRKYMVNSNGQGLPVIDLEGEKQNDCLKNLFTYLLKFKNKKICNIDHLMNTEIQNMDNNPILSNIIPSKNFIVYEQSAGVYRICSFYFPIGTDFNDLIDIGDDGVAINFETFMSRQDKYYYTFYIFDSNNRTFFSIREQFSMNITDQFINFVLFNSSLIDKCIIFIKSNMEKFKDEDLTNFGIGRDICSYMQTFDY